jgi:hypothetical protein
MSQGSKPPKIKMPKFLRQRPREHQELIAPYALNVGRVLWEWNVLHSSFFRIFWAFIGDGGKLPRNLPTELWHSTASDDHQRRMIRALSKHQLFDQPRLRKRLDWLLDTANEIATYRNIAAHVSMTIDKPEGRKPHITFELDGGKRSVLLRHLIVTHRESDFWSDLADDLYVMSQHSDVIGLQLAFPEQPLPLPYRPRLLSLPRILEANKQANRMVHKPRRRSRRRRP